MPYLQLVDNGDDTRHGLRLVGQHARVTVERSQLLTVGVELLVVELHELLRDILEVVRHFVCVLLFLIFSLSIVWLLKARVVGTDLASSLLLRARRRSRREREEELDRVTTRELG